MGVLPCPHTRTLFGFHNLTVFPLGAYKCDVTIVHFRLLIEQSEDTLGTGKCHHDIVKLHRELVDWLPEALIIGKKTCELSERKSAISAQSKNTADDRAEHVADITDLCIDRH